MKRGLYNSSKAVCGRRYAVGSMMVFILTLLTTALCGDGGASPLQLTFKQVAFISQEQIRVADLIESWEGEYSDLLRLQHIVIDTLPYSRRMLNVNSAIISQRIKAQNPSAELKFPRPIIAVRWLETTLSADIVTEKAIEFLRRHYQLSEDAEINIMNIPRIAIPSEDVTLTISKSQNRDDGTYIRLDGKVQYEGNTHSVFSFLARVSQPQFVYQANRSVRRGESINFADFDRVLMTVNPNNHYVSAEPPFIPPYEGGQLQAANLISKGSYLKKSDIVTTPEVQRNELVTVLVQGQAMQLSYQAIAKANGWLGDRIMLENPDSRQTFYAQVIDKNKVIIKLED